MKMISRIIIIYSSVDGQTKKICKHIRESLIVNNHSVEIFSIDNLPYTIDQISKFDKIVIASSIRYGKHNEHIVKFIQDNFEFLNSKKTAFLSVNLVARKKEKSKPDTNPYVAKFLNSIKWKPTICTVFAGKLNYKLYPFRDRIMIKLIMLMTKGPTDSKTEIEYTDWNDVDKFVKDLMEI